MFVRRKKVKGNTYYQLVRSYRENGKHRQQFLCHLGRHKSLEEAIAAERKLAEEHEDEAVNYSDEAQSTKEILFEDYGEEIGHTVPSRRQADLRWRAFWKEYGEKYERPYRRWKYSLEEQGEEQRAAEQEVWEERRLLWNERGDDEEKLADLIDWYHHAVSQARSYEKWAAFHRAALTKFLDAKRKFGS